mgnify:CR=1 FL=1
MSLIAVIPARLESSRFPGKPLKLIHGLPMVGHVYKRARMCKELDEVYVATCNLEIFDFIISIGGKAIMTKNTHERCTDRTFEAIKKIENEEGKKIDAIVMIQGDEPMVTPEMIRASLGPIVSGSEDVVVTNLTSKIASEKEHADPNEVKVVFDKNWNALYFSREPIPSNKKFSGDLPMWKQVCVITFTRNFLEEYSSLEPTPLEIVESVDMNRVLEHGYSVKLIETKEESFAVDTQDDLKFVEKKMKNDLLMKSYLE